MPRPRTHYDDKPLPLKHLISSIVEPLSFRKVLSRCALRLLALPVSSAEVERESRFSHHPPDMPRIINRKECASFSETIISYSILECITARFAIVIGEK